MNQKAVIYCRVSSEKQVREGNGIKSQEQRCRQYAKAQEYSVLRVFKDEAISGGLLERPGMQEMLVFLEEQPFDAPTIVIVDDIKRWARDVQAHFALKTAIYTRNAKLESPSYKFEDSAEGKFVETVLAGAAELERNQNKRQVCNRMKARLESGYWCFDNPPGYIFKNIPGHGKMLVPDESKAGVIKEALEGFASGRFLEQMDVQHFLDSKNFHHRKQCGKVHLEQVKRLLTRILYAGYVEYPKWKVERRKGHHDALISLETYERIQDRLGLRQGVSERKDSDPDFPLRGFVLCNGCGKRLTASWTQSRGNLFPYYRCKTRVCAFGQKSVKRKVMEDAFKKILSDVRSTEEVLEFIKAVMTQEWNSRMADVQSARRERGNRLEAVKSEIKALTKRISQTERESLVGAYEEQIEELQQERRNLEKKVGKSKRDSDEFGTALDHMLGYIKDPYGMWQTRIFEDQRLVLKLLFDEPLRFDKERGFGTARFSLPVTISEEGKRSKSQMVEMPGVEPGSNVSTGCLYRHVPSGSSGFSRRNENEPGRVDAERSDHRCVRR